MSVKKSRRYCEICGVRESHLENRRFFANFPLEETRCREWVRVTGNEDLVHLPIEKLHQNKHICVEHFKKTQINKSHTRLKKRAVPCLNLLSTPLSDDQMLGFPLHMWNKQVIDETPSTSKEGQQGANEETGRPAQLQEMDKLKSLEPQRPHQIQSKGEKRKLPDNEEEHKLVLVGLDNAGKTTILYQLLLGEAVHTRPTIGSNVEEVVWKNLRFVMWDLGGQQSLRSAWNTYYTNSEFVIMVIDSTDRQRLSISREELHRMLTHEELSRACLLVFANKQDVKGSMTAAEISEQLDLTSIKQHPWHIQACCALTGEGLHLGLEWIASRIKKK